MAMPRRGGNVGKGGPRTSNWKRQAKRFHMPRKNGVPFPQAPRGEQGKKAQFSSKRHLYACGYDVFYTRDRPQESAERPRGWEMGMGGGSGEKVIWIYTLTLTHPPAFLKMQAIPQGGPGSESEFCPSVTAGTVAVPAQWSVGRLVALDFYLFSQAISVPSWPHELLCHTEEYHFHLCMAQSNLIWKELGAAGRSWRVLEGESKRGRRGVRYSIWQKRIFPLLPSTFRNNSQSRIPSALCLTGWWNFIQGFFLFAPLVVMFGRILVWLEREVLMCVFWYW